MATPRFYCPPPLHAHSRFTLPDPQAHHARRVLRLADGSAVRLFDGRGGEYGGTLHYRASRTEVELGAHDPIERELAGRLNLVQGLASAERMDWIIEKAVEAGYAELFPVLAQRSVPRLGGARLEKRLQRWRTIIQVASSQCGRNRLMQVHPPAPLADCLAHQKGTTLFFHPEGQQTLAQVLPRSTAPLSLAIGPEGGWAPEELASAKRLGLEIVGFGPRVLRTETAGLALAFATTALLGWETSQAQP